jgi:hypothetical protein
MERRRDGVGDRDGGDFVEVAVQALGRRRKRGEGVGNDGERWGPFIVAGEGHARVRQGGNGRQ